MTVLPQTLATSTERMRSPVPPILAPKPFEDRGFVDLRDGHGPPMAPSPSSTVSSSVSSGRMLSIYLRHHVAASRGGVDLFHRSARTQLGNEARRELRDLTAEVTQDREQLLRVLRRLGIPRPRFAEVLVGVAETLGRLKPNGTLVRRSPLSDVMELEALSTAVTAKRLGWVTLRLVGERDGPFDPAEIDALIARAEAQHDRLEALRGQAVLRALGGAGSEH